MASWRDEAGQSSAARGYGLRWRYARAAYLAEHPLCVMCYARGYVVPASVVDHIKPHRGDQSLFWDSANWQALCKPCHDSDKRREENGKARIRYDANGTPVW